ncbi:MAG: DUF2341 domain-containing protein [Candidatus Pacebacteria bacterium]|nr:DUF2341 domain-containing protein [Candidatus Paceibacterota bacterium]
MQNAKRKILISALFIAGVIALAFSIFWYADQKQVSVSAAGESWLSGYSKRKAVTVTNSNTGTAGTVNGSAALGGTGKFGTAITMDGTDDYISFADSADWDFDGDFTIDFWINSSNISAYQFPLVHRNYPSYVGAWHFYISGSKFTFSAADNSGTAIISLADTTTRTSNTWYHVAIVRSGATANMYVNGSLAVSDTSASGAISNDSDVLIVGYLKNYGAYFAGSLDEVRISKGIARWTSNFVPSTSAYSNDSYTKLLLHLNETSGTTVYSDLTLTDYQVKLTVPYDSDMQADFDDLRFTSSDGTTLLNYWLESKTDSSTATIWVKVPTLSSGSNTIYMYYGNASATSGGDGTGVFIFFDDFDDGSIDSSKWTASGTWTESGGTITSPLGTLKYLRSSAEILSGLSSFVVEGRTRALHSYGYGMRMGLKTGATPASNGTQYEPIVAYTYGAYSPMMVINGSNACSGGTQASSGTWYRGKIVINPGASSIYEYNDSGTLVGSCTTSSVSAGSGNYLAIFNADGQTEQDWIFVRKYASADPTSSFGSEEVNGGDSSCVSSASVNCSQNIVGSYAVNTYTLSGSSTGSVDWIPPAEVTSVEYLVVAGGGAGGFYLNSGGSGGGGAGGLLTGTLSVTSSPTYKVIVGNGGTPQTTYVNGGNGGNSSFGSIVATGGGGGAAWALNGSNGGSGGGGAGLHTGGTTGGTGISGQGYAGGGHSSGEAPPYCAAGGGGASHVGYDGASSVAGNGGEGISSSITGSALNYAGGGGGSCRGSGTAGIGIYGGGTGSISGAGAAGTANTGGGGGGGETAAGAGGSGIVIIKYMIDSTAPTLAQVTAVPSPTSDTTPSYTFSSTEAGTITYGGDCSSSTTSAVSGNNTITFNALAEGVHSNCTIMVTDSLNNQSSVLNVNSFTVANNSCWYCDYYFNTSNVLQAGKNGQLDFTFKYEDSDSSATLSGYRIAIDTEDLSLADIDSQADILSPSSSTWSSGGSAASGATITYSGTSVKISPSAALYQIGYGNGSSVKTYYWWVKVKNSAGLESDWVPGPSFNTPKKHYPIVRVVANKETITTNTDIQYCSGTDLSGQDDPELRDACYSVCWKGAAGSAVVDPDNTNWKCSVCYDSSGSPVSCSTLNDGNTNFTWKVPTGYVEDADYTLVSGTLTSANPVIKFLTAGTNLSMGLNITGSECGAEQAGDIKIGLPTWREIAPF